MKTDAETIVTNIINGNLMDAMDSLFEYEGPELARMTADVIDELVLTKIISTNVACTQLTRLINAWERNQ